MKLQIPNTLTIGRIILVPIFVFSFYLPGLLGDLIPFFIFILASFTDFLDGLLARLYKEESKLGELLDPIADKIIVAAALVLLVMNDTIILSAIGSRSSPSFDSSLYNLANKPSRKSVKLASIKMKKGIKSPRKPGI